MAVMPAFVADRDALATKILTIYPQNKDSPTIQSYILLYNPANGNLLCMMDGYVITEMRTAAASAIATKYLAPTDSQILCIIGAGVQARSHYRVLLKQQSFREIRLYCQTTKHAERFADEFPGVIVHTSAEEAVRNADVIVLAVFTEIPVLFADWVKPGAHINSIGANTPTTRELDPALVKSSVIYVDSYEGATTGSGDIILSQAEIFAEIGEVIIGSKEAKKEQTTIFKSQGMACQDAVAAKLVWDSYNEDTKFTYY